MFNSLHLRSGRGQAAAYPYSPPRPCHFHPAICANALPFLTSLPSLSRARCHGSTARPAGPPVPPGWCRPYRLLYRCLLPPLMALLPVLPCRHGACSWPAAPPWRYDGGCPAAPRWRPGTDSSRSASRAAGKGSRLHGEVGRDLKQHLLLAQAPPSPVLSLLQPSPAFLPPAGRSHCSSRCRGHHTSPAPAEGTPRDPSRGAAAAAAAYRPGT